MKENKSSWLSSIFAGLIGGAVFLFLLFVVNIGLLIALGGATAGFVAGLLLTIKGKAKKSLNIFLEGVTDEVVREKLQQGLGKLDTMQELASQIQQETVRRDADAVIEIVIKILEDLKKDPKDIKIARSFLDYYLDTTINILRRYVDLSEHKQYSPDIQRSLAKVETMLGTIRRAFEKQLARLLADDVLDLDVELEVLEKSIRMEGLGESVHER
ncbi:MAG: 5-bromo-4-chloroindolyl phosphate hydrolysis family protein [Acidobacteria bacterium]|nr:5-bromo-4-chloroindolyl phosphate hydrolysis family protein [Acidobacteriota bacterium]